MARIAIKGICDVCKRGPKPVPYITSDGSGRMCAACYHDLGRSKCSICGRVKVILYRGAEKNRKICSDCYRKQAGNYEGICPECGKKGPIHYKGKGSNSKKRICRKCNERFRALECIAEVLGEKPGAVAMLNSLIVSKNSRARVKEVLSHVFQLKVPRLQAGILRFCGTPGGEKLKILYDKIQAGR